MAQATAMPETIGGRRLVPEVMDNPGLDAAAHAAALRGLGRINAVSGSVRIVWRGIEAAARRRAASERGRALRVVDLACGGGDVAVGVLKRARRAGLHLQVTGCDVSGTALDHARTAAARAGVALAVERVDALQGALPAADVVMCSLFLHHLTVDDAATVLTRMRDAAGDTLLVNDLRRSGAGFAAAVMGTRLLSRSPVVHIDGPRSVRAAFTSPELAALAARAGLQGATVGRRFPWRMLLTWRRP